MSALAPPGPEATRPAPPRNALRHRLAERGVDRTLLLLVPGLLASAALFCYPFLYGLQISFQPKTGGFFGSYRAFFGNSFAVGSIGITFKLALPAAIINVGAAVPISYRMRKEFRGKRLLLALLVVPITLGTVLTAEGIVEFFGPVGWFNQTLHALGLAASPVKLTYDYWGVLLSLIISGFPFAFLLTNSYLSGIHPALERAAATLGADWRQRFRHITFPLLLPGLMTTFCLTFVLAFAVFPSAMMVGDPDGRTHVISVEAYETALEHFNYSEGSAIAMVMTALMLAVVGVAMGLRSRLYRGSTGGKG
ncbi:binding-protein-dependent transport systems inner membrane component [Catenulispora acidiphila DSM 44928]|uniref:Binding-protein-dependent transport systems inner membrane component n=1 Tax=Catenulispora acidiphila (strain DSM 44928 / JCM 14897 / NBRC 102108 / NRRL B-24433 / ID139908) TaxID=479433 RepID=C7Q3E5_CATAD|nr:ABC transporter permease subunit [Catenulispora acidiphila]ACU75710.1 binding-protein-dependent transport systems inner membrane component [Catenulispora acidiphila DSM 44928]